MQASMKNASNVQTENPYEEFYYSTVCHVCKVKKKDLKSCNSCKIFRYCCVAHQKKHWPGHSELCKILRKFIEVTKQQNCFSLTENNWLISRMKIKFVLEHELCRPLLPVENQIWMFPRACAVCHNTSRDLLFDCSYCPAVSYCSIDHQNEHKDKHKEICHLMDLQYKFYCNRLKYTNPVPLTVNFSYQDVINIYSNNKEIVEDEMLKKMWLGDKLSHVSTIMNTLIECKLLVNFNIQEDGLVIHIVGVTYEWANFDRLVSELLFHWIPNLKKIHLVFIGPELTHNTIPKWKYCGLCLERNVEACYYFIPLLYSQYYYSKGFKSPNIIAIFNCGFHETMNSDNDLWLDTLPLLLMPNVPLLLTSYTFKESIQDLSRIEKIFTNISPIKLFKRCEKNLYCSTLPLRDWIDLDEIYFINNYYSILKKLEH